VSQYMVVDNEAEVAVGPFETQEAAKAFFIERAQAEEWGDVCDLIEATGSPFVSSFRQDGLVLIDFDPVSTITDEDPNGHCEANEAEHWRDGDECGMCGGRWVMPGDEPAI
jgi:hypothetical protein